MPKRVFVLGATGTIGRATVRALLRRGHEVACFVRARAAVDHAALLAGTSVRIGDVRDPASLARDGFRGERFDALVSCLASRTGAPADAWAIDHQAHVHALAAARESGVALFVLLSAICVQKPLLAFQHAKPGVIRALIAARADPVLFELSYDYVGDLSETVALMWPAPIGMPRYDAASARSSAWCPLTAKNVTVAIIP